MSAVVQSRRSRQTGTLVEIVDNRDGSFDCDDPNPWFTVCVDHGNVCSHETRHLAEAFAPIPREWCETCQEPTEECGEIFRDKLGNACRCTKEPHEGSHRGVVVWENS